MLEGRRYQVYRESGSGGRIPKRHELELRLQSGGRDTSGQEGTSVD